MALTAPTVSRTLRTAGFGIVQTRSREGIRVSGGAFKGQVCVVVDLDRPGEQARGADCLAKWLQDNAASLGWAWERRESFFYLATAKGIPTEQAERLKRDSAATQLGAQVQASVTRLRVAIYTRAAPAQADITAARSGLEALIRMAAPAAVPKTREEMAQFANEWDAKVDQDRAKEGTK